jgi:hypothetical protein
MSKLMVRWIAANLLTLSVTRISDSLFYDPINNPKIELTGYWVYVIRGQKRSVRCNYDGTDPQG